MLKHPVSTSPELRSFASLFVKQYLNRHFVAQKATPQQKLLAQALLEISQATPLPQKREPALEAPKRGLVESNVKRESFERRVDKRASRKVISDFIRHIFSRTSKKTGNRRKDCWHIDLGPAVSAKRWKYSFADIYYWADHFEHY